MASHDITYVGIIQTARASGLKQFPLPYVLTNCHNSLCAVGGTINEDDHVFGLSAARKYGGEFVPAHQAVIHSYMRERYAGCGRMILGSDSHTRYGAFGTIAFGEGGPELVKQLLNRTYDIAYPRVIAVYLTGKPNPGVGPQDVALDLIRTVFQPGTVKNAVLEFFGPGVANLAMDYRCGIDVMTTETACLSSVWCTDDTTRKCLEVLGRGDAYQPMAPQEGAWYDDLVEIPLDQVEPMIALPFHPSNAYTIREFKANAEELLHGVDEATLKQFELKAPPAPLTEKLKNGEFYVDQAVIAGCSGGTWQNLMRTAEILKGETISNMAFWPVGVPRQPAHLPGSGQARPAGGPDRRRCHHPLLLLRPLLRRRRRARQRRFLHPPLHPELPQPGGQQARQRPDRLCGPDGRPEHRRHRQERRQTHRRYRAGLCPRGQARRALRV